MDQHQKKQHFRKGLWGLQFKNGKLYEFTPESVVVMRPWPQPMAWYKRRSHGWRPTRKLADAVVSKRDFFSIEPKPEPPTCPFALPDGQLLLPGVTLEEWWAQRQYKDAVSRCDFIRLIPEEVRQELSRYRTRRWHLLNVIARCPGALDLSQSSPALLFALASNWVFHKPAVTKPIRSVRNLVNRRQCDIQQWLGFPGTESVRLLLSKIKPEALSILSLIFLHSVISDPVCLKLLGHLPVISEATLALATQYRIRPHVTPHLLRDALQQEEEQLDARAHCGAAKEVIYLVQDTIRMCEVVHWEHCPTLFRSLVGVQRLHDALVPRVNEAMRVQADSFLDRLPNPPFAGTDKIAPLTTVTAMVNEGVEQHNCAAVRAPLVAQGSQYLYRVTEPVRGTLAVRFNGIGWEPLEFRLACNKPVPEAIWTTTFEALFRSGSYVACPNFTDAQENLSDGSHDVQTVGGLASFDADIPYFEDIHDDVDDEEVPF